MKNIILATTIVLCLGLISCGEIINKPIVIDNATGISGADRGLVKISHILIESDLIIIGECYKIEEEEDAFPLLLLSAHIKITEVLKGSTTEKKVQFNNISFNEFNKNDKCILFLRKDGDSYALTTEENDFFNESIMLIELPYVNDSYYCEADIKLLLKAYNRNRDLFSKVGKQDLFKLYPQIKAIRAAVLSDLEDLVDENDIEFFANGLQSDDDQYNLFSIRKIGYFRIEQFKETIADLLKTTPDIPINNNKIFHLLVALGEYADMKYKDVFFWYMDNDDSQAQGFRNVSKHAIRILYIEKTNSEERLAILNALEEKIKNDDVLISLLLDLKENIETEEHLINKIDDIIAKRIGG